MKWKKKSIVLQKLLLLKQYFFFIILIDKNFQKIYGEKKTRKNGDIGEIGNFKILK